MTDGKVFQTFQLKFWVLQLYARIQRYTPLGEEGITRGKMDCLDMKTMTWSTCPDLLQGLVLPVAGCVDYNIYVIFSTTPDNERTAQGLTLKCFDTTKSSWSFKASMPNAVKQTHGAATVAIDHCLFVLGGYQKICLSYDTRKDSWTILTSPLNWRAYGAAVYLKGKIILSGGYNKDNLIPSDGIESYDPTTNTWTILPVQLPKPLKHFCIIPA